MAIYTKWDFLSGDARAALDAMTFGQACTACGTILATEGDFARHFIIPDANYLNLGECPSKATITATRNATRAYAPFLRDDARNA